MEKFASMIPLVSFARDSNGNHREKIKFHQGGFIAGNGIVFVNGGIRTRFHVKSRTEHPIIAFVTNRRLD